MKNLAIACALAFYSAHALACPLSETLAKRYGISFFGFKTALPVAAAPDPTDAGAFVRIRIRDESNVSDGFHHTIVMDTKTKKAWILRTGGFVSVYQWFGPVEADATSLEQCKLEPVPAFVQESQKQ